MIKHIEKYRLEVYKVNFYKKVLIILLVMIGEEALFAQQDIQFSQFQYNVLSYNPAYAGINSYNLDKNYFEGQLTHRSQWVGYTPTFDEGGAPTTQFLGLNMPLAKYNSGVGLILVRDKLGPITNYDVQLSYAYHVNVRKSKISLGLRTGFYSQSLNFDKFRALNPNDVFLTKEGNQVDTRFDMAVGAFVNNPKYFFGASANHIVPSEVDFGTGVAQEPLSNHLTFVGAYHLDINNDLIISPNFLLKTNLEKALSFDVGAMAKYQNKYLLGLSYRHQEAAILLTGVNFRLKKDRVFRLLYSLDYVFLGKKAKQVTSHEITLAYLIPVFVKVPSIIRTPRNRHY